MPIYPNHTKRTLAEGGIAIGMGLRLARSVDIATIGKTCGYDWLFIDMEHNSMDVDNAAQIAMASLAVGITPIVRVPGKEHFHATRLLDSGAQGIVVPHVDTVEEAERAVAYCKYPPKGHRSAMGTLPQFAYQAVPVGEATKAANEETLVIVMVESPEAIERVEQIAAVPGIDSVLIGTNDLCAEMGIPGKFDDARVEDAYRKVVAACKKNGIHPGMGGVYDPKLMEKYIGYGMRLILSGGDISFLMAGAKQRAEFLKGITLT
ncbi:MAG TPA: aldolase/citrate lyase family protein [Burkholderiales bacterium]|nr:aldolase/citrate lyase family protein [Burkholderiales bacterium]